MEFDFSVRMYNIIWLINKTTRNIEESEKEICQNRFCIGNKLIECMQFHLRHLLQDFKTSKSDFCKSPLT